MIFLREGQDPPLPWDFCNCAIDENLLCESLAHRTSLVIARSEATWQSVTPILPGDSHAACGSSEWHGNWAVTAPLSMRVGRGLGPATFQFHFRRERAHALHYDGKKSYKIVFILHYAFCIMHSPKYPPVGDAKFRRIGSKQPLTFGWKRITIQSEVLCIPAPCGAGNQL